MKDYIIKEVDGHHVVHILSDKELRTSRSMAETIQQIFDAVEETVEYFIENMRIWIKENIKIDDLEDK